MEYTVQLDGGVVRTYTLPDQAIMSRAVKVLPQNWTHTRISFTIAGTEVLVITKKSLSNKKGTRVLEEKVYVTDALHPGVSWHEMPMSEYARRQIILKGEIRRKW